MAGPVEFQEVRVSLEDLLGSEYTNAVCRAAAAVTGREEDELRSRCSEKLNLYPRSMADDLRLLLPQVGKHVCDGLAASAKGVTTGEFTKATKNANAPLSGLGYYRVGEDGRLHLISKSEHYHASVGHCFPGYQMIELARRLGIPNATHNNTRGHITRLLEEELARTAGAGLARLRWRQR